MRAWFSACVLSASILYLQSAADDSYENIKSLQDSILSPSRYSATLRPVRNQTKVLQVYVSFSLVAIVSLDDVKQELVTNGFLFLTWWDERSSWDPNDYGGIIRIAPEPKQIWRPRLLLINTLGDRDPFEDDYSHTIFFADGSMAWVPGGLFKTYCRLNMEKFPFDVQNCYIQLCPSSYTNETLKFIPETAVNTAFYFPNPGWELVRTTVSEKVVSVVGDEEVFSCPTVDFVLKRRPDTIVLNVILPILLMSLLNNMVFLIPVESGEKISYAVTVLLSLSVFLSMVSRMTPQVTDTVPALSIYLFVLLISSVLTVGAAIFTVFLHHKEEKEEVSLKCKANFKHSVSKALKMRAVAVAPLERKSNDLSEEFEQDTVSSQQELENPPEGNKYKTISKHINKIFFVIVTVSWIAVNIWFFVASNS